jgi:hypothetical protein
VKEKLAMILRITGTIAVSLVVTLLATQGVLADALGAASSFNAAAKARAAAPGATRSLNPQPLPPGPPGDPERKSGIIIVGGKNKSARMSAKVDAAKPGVAHSRNPRLRARANSAQKSGIIIVGGKSKSAKMRSPASQVAPTNAFETRQ